MYALITGGRDYHFGTDDHLWLDTFKRLYGFTAVVVGDATGVDAHALLWALRHKLPVERFYARWKSEGTAAGPRRNGRMIAHCLAQSVPTMVVAFPGGRGTADCCRQAAAAGLRILDIPAKHFALGERVRYAVPHYTGPGARDSADEPYWVCGRTVSEKHWRAPAVTYDLARVTDPEALDVVTCVRPDQLLRLP